MVKSLLSSKIKCSNVLLKRHLIDNCRGKNVIPTFIRIYSIKIVKLKKAFDQNKVSFISYDKSMIFKDSLSKIDFQISITFF